MIKRGLTLDNALNIIPRIFINDAGDPEPGCTTGRARMPVSDQGTDRRCASEKTGDDGSRREAVAAVTNGHLEFGTWERIFAGEAEWLARESRRAMPEAGVGQDHRGVGALRAILSVTDCASGGPQPRNGLCDKKPRAGF
jgi:hypothetical protein